MDEKLYLAPEYPQESYSRQLDNMVAAQEYPYGYVNNPPPYGHENPASKEQMNQNKGK